MTQFSFLEFPLSSIRRSIKDIDDSYRNPWDIYAELSQNAVDAIRKMQETSDEEGKIKIIINSQEKSIIFEDNGCGIAQDDLPQMLKLFSSLLLFSSLSRIRGTLPRAFQTLRHTRNRHIPPDQTDVLVVSSTISLSYPL